MIRYRATWVVPITGPPVRCGWVDVEDGRIVALSPAGDSDPAKLVDMDGLALLPGLVNAHTHLELAPLRGKVLPARTMPAWVRELLRQRSQVSAGQASPAIGSAIDELHQTGTVLIGDVSNTLAPVGALAASGLTAVVFHELIKFDASEDQAEGLVRDAVARWSELPQTGALRMTLAAHAPYSTGPALFRAIVRSMARRPDAPLAVHLGESREEIEFLDRGTGAWRGLLEDLGVWDPGWVVPGCRPVEYLRRLGWLDRRTLVVHGGQLRDDELADLAACGTTLVTCPRSNRWTGAGEPPVERFFASGVRLAIGTDSLASTPDLNLFSELAEMRRAAPKVPARRLLQSATLVGAQALGFGAAYGAITPGRRAALIGVRVPSSIADVEEYLVNGIVPDDIQWVQPAPRP